jgi:hypothetical protein
MTWMEKIRNACNILLGKLKKRKTVGRHRHRWEDNIKVGFVE